MPQLEAKRELRSWSTRSSLGNCLLPLNFKALLLHWHFPCTLQAPISPSLKERKIFLSSVFLSNKNPALPTPLVSQLSSMSGLHCLRFQFHPFTKAFLTDCHFWTLFLFRNFICRFPWHSSFLFLLSSLSRCQILSSAPNLKKWCSWAPSVVDCYIHRP